MLLHQCRVLLSQGRILRPNCLLVGRERRILFIKQRVFLTERRVLHRERQVLLVQQRLVLTERRAFRFEGRILLMKQRVFCHEGRIPRLEGRVPLPQRGDHLCERRHGVGQRRVFHGEGGVLLLQGRGLGGEGRFALGSPSVRHEHALRRHRCALGFFRQCLLVSCLERSALSLARGHASLERCGGCIGGDSGVAVLLVSCRECRCYLFLCGQLTDEVVVLCLQCGDEGAVLDAPGRGSGRGGLQLTDAAREHRCLVNPRCQRRLQPRQQAFLVVDQSFEVGDPRCQPATLVDHGGVTRQLAAHHFLRCSQGVL